MAYLGTGVPLIQYMDRVAGRIKTIQLKEPVRNGRNEDYEEETNKWTNPLTGAQLEGEPRYRFVGEYRFPSLNINTMNKLIEMENETRLIKFFPNGGLVGFRCRFEVAPKHLDGYLEVDTVRLKVREYKWRDNKPTLDSVVKGTRMPSARALVRS